MADTPRGQRIPGEQVRCHECSSKWPREHGGLECPRCGSEFVEILSDSNPPSPEPVPQNLPSASPGDDQPNHTRSPGSREHHDPWPSAPDPAEDDIEPLSFGGGQRQPGAYHWESRSPNGASSFSISVFSSGGGPVRFTSNRGLRHTPHTDPVMGEIDQDFREMIQDVTGMRPPQQYGPGQQAPPRGPIPGGPSMPVPGFFPGPMGQQQHQPFGHPGSPFIALLNTIFPAMGGGVQQGPAGPAGPNAGLFAMLRHMIDPANASSGDAVFTQEALDRVMTQLMEQHQGSNAAGPASDDAIQNLPKKEVSKNMLDEKGTAECSICMDSVSLGEIVTALPCTHWFHQACITAWLKEHDTCPHCRKGITPPPEPSQSPSQQNPRSPPSPSSRPSLRTHRRSSAASMPGAWQSSRSASSQNMSPTRENRQHHRQSFSNNDNNHHHLHGHRHQSEPLESMRHSSNHNSPRDRGFPRSPTSPSSFDSRRRTQPSPRHGSYSFNSSPNPHAYSHHNSSRNSLGSGSNHSNNNNHNGNGNSNSPSRGIAEWMRSFGQGGSGRFR